MISKEDFKDIKKWVFTGKKREAQGKIIPHTLGKNTYDLSFKWTIIITSSLKLRYIEFKESKRKGLVILRVRFWGGTKKIT